MKTPRILDQHGRPMRQQASSPAFDAAGRGRRAIGWMPSSSSINALLSGSVATLRNRSRDLVRKNSWASNALDVFVSNVIGNGIVPRPMIEDDDLRGALLEAWAEFVEECDADGAQDFYGIQALAVRAYKEAGDCFIRLRPRRASDGLSVPLQLQVLEAELVDETFNDRRTEAIQIKGGIELDALGRRIAYHMHPEHPGELLRRRVERVRVAADNVIHVFHPVRPGQLRGIPGMATVLVLLHELDKYNDAEVMRKQTTAMFAGFLFKPVNEGDVLGAGSEGTDADERPIASLEPATLQELPPGWQIEFSKPADVGESYGEFLRAQLRASAAGVGITYEQLTGDLTGVNFSSIRAGLIEFRRRIEQIQRRVVVFQLCRRVWNRFVEAAVLAGRIPLPTDGDLRPLLRVKWTPTPGWEYVDPQKEVKSQQLAVKAGFTSRSKIVMEHGWDPEELDREIAADNDRARRLGLRFADSGGANAAVETPDASEPELEETDQRGAA